jgi:hypothetical protein
MLSLRLKATIQEMVQRRLDRVDVVDQVHGFDHPKPRSHIVAGFEQASKVTASWKKGSSVNPTLAEAPKFLS